MQEDMKQQKYCTKCGKKLDENTKFCGSCGTENIDINEYICDKCGTYINENDQFCSSCGKKINYYIIYCSKCGKKLTGNMHYCSDCGNKITHKTNFKNKDEIISFLKDNLYNIWNNRKKRRITIATLIIITIILFFSLNLSKEEKYVIDSIKILKDELKDPDSLKLRDDILLLVDTESEKVTTYVEYSATNDYGGVVSSCAYIVNGEVLDAQDYEDDDYTDASKGLLYMQVKLELMECLDGDIEKDQKFSIIDMKKIAKRMNIKYEK